MIFFVLLIGFEPIRKHLRLPFRHRGIYHIGQAFWFSRRTSILLSPHCAIGVPEDVIIVIRAGLKPAAPNLEGLCSIQLSYRTKFPHLEIPSE